MGRIDQYPEFPNQNPNSPVALAYNRQSAVLGPFAGSENIFISVTVAAAEGRRLKISAFTNLVGSVAGQSFEGQIYRDGVAIEQDHFIPASYATPFRTGLHVETIDTPSAGTHDYAFVVGIDQGGGTVSTAGDYWILVEDITGMPVPTPAISVPVGLLGRAEQMNNIGVTTTATAISGLSVNVAVPAGRTLKVTLHGSVFFSMSVDMDIFTRILMDGANIQLQQQRMTAAINNQPLGTMCAVVSPSAGSHTFTATVATNAGTAQLAGSSAYPIFLSVEDITPTPAAANTAPSSTLAYTQVTANQGSIAGTPVDLTGLAATITVPAGRRIKITGIVGFYSDTTDRGGALRIHEGSTLLSLGIVYVPVAGNVATAVATYITSPSAGAHTYKLVATHAISGTTTMYAAADNPAFILIEDITENAALFNVNNTKGFINHGAAAGAARPTGYASVEWYGSVEPTNAVAGDTWVDTS